MKQNFSLLRALSKPEGFFVSLMLIFGILAVYLIPMGAGPDEETHMIRVWDMSLLQVRPRNAFIPNNIARKNLPLPRALFDLSYRRLPIVRPVEGPYLSLYGQLDLEARDLYTDGMLTRSVYSPPLLLPQALVMKIVGRTLDLPLGWVYFTTRLATLISYIVLVWFAIRIMPYGKWLVAIVALTPTTAFNAATINTDPLSIGIALVFIAGCLNIQQKDRLSWKEWGYLCLTFSLLFWAKINVVTLGLLPFLIIRPAKFHKKSQYWLLIGAAFLIALIEIGGWNYVAAGKFFTEGGRADPSEQISFVVGHPFQFAGIVLSDLWQNGLEYFLSGTALFGYGYWFVPSVTYLFFMIALLAAIQVEDQGMTWNTRLIMWLVFILGYVATVGSLYASNTPVGINAIYGVQGRYFTPIILALLLPLIGILHWRPKPVKWMPAVFGTLSLASFLIALYLSYYVPCGFTYYRSRMCIQPFYKNYGVGDDASMPVNAGTTLSQEIITECDGLAKVFVWADSSEAAPEQFTQITITEQSSQRVIFDQEIANSLIPENNWIEMNVEPQWDSLERTYIIEIQGAETTDQGITIPYTQLEQYQRGQLLENGKAQDADLFFQYGCITGLEKLSRGY